MKSLEKMLAKPLLVFKKYHMPILILVSILVIFLLFSLLRINKIIDALELKLYDFRTIVYVRTQAKTPDPDIVLLIHDNESNRIINDTKDLGVTKWPFPRDKWQTVLMFLNAAPDKLSLFDVKFDSKSQDSKDDEVFAKAVKNSDNVVLAYIMSTSFSNILPDINNNFKELNEKQNKLEKKQTKLEQKQMSYFDFLDAYLNIYINVALSNINVNKSIVDLYKEKFIFIPKEQYLQLKTYTLLSISFLTSQGESESFLEAAHDIGIINMPYDDNITEVCRDNKPLWRYQNTSLFGQHLALIPASIINGVQYSFTKNILGQYFNINNRTFAINKEGNIYINWRKKPVGDNPNSPGAFKTYPLAKVFVYEKFQTMNPLEGFYETPEDQKYLYWHSHYNNLVLNPVEDVYFNYLAYYMGLYLAENDFSYYNSYSNNLIRMSRNNSSVQFLNYLKEIEYLKHQNYFYNKLNLVSFTPSLSEYPGFGDLSFDNIGLAKPFSPISKIMDITYDKNFNPELFINKYVILGEATATGDVHSVSISKVYPGPEIVATAMDNYLNDGTWDSLLVRKAPWWIDVIVAIFFIYITIMSILKTDTYVSNISVFLSMLVIFVLFNVILFIIPFTRLWLNMVYPTFFILLAAISTIAYKNMVIDKDKNQIKNLFGKFVSPQVLESVLANPDMLSVKVPIKKEMTVLFSDIRDFTSKSEQIPPMELIPQLNEYFTEMVEVIIMDYNGTLDKYMGDAIMAFWGDPVPMEDHAKNAVLAALAMQQHLKLLNERWEKESKPPMSIGIGINSGEMIVGHMGSPRLVDYTVLGDNVNIASRVEGLNKQYGTEILITEATYELVKDIVEVAFLDSVTVKGKTKTINVYNVLKLKDNVNVNFDNNPTLFIDGEIK